MQGTVRRPYQPFVPNSKGPCLCGSGLRYKACCSTRLPGYNNGTRWKRFAKEQRWVEMIRHLRADVTQYTIWHLSHTALAVANRPELRHAYLMNLDIEALSDYVESLMWGYARKGWLGRLPATLDRLRTNIDDPRWHAKIAYQRGISALWQHDRAQAAREIAALQPITPDQQDIDLLQIHLDLHGQAMGMSERVAFFDAIRTRSKSRSDTLQYGGARAFEILLTGDDAGARVAFGEVLTLGRAMEEEKPFNATCQIWFSKALEGLAVLDDDAALFTEIDERLSGLIADPTQLAASGCANVWKLLGDARRYAGRHDAAIDAYRASITLEAAPELRTFEAECELRRGDPDTAFRLLRSIAIDALKAPQRADHAFTSFYVALARGDRQSLLDARELLKAAVTPQPYFENRRLQYIITIGDALEALDDKAAPPPLGPLLSALERVSRYVQLQPNWNGLGIDGNAMIDDFLANAQERLKALEDRTPTYPDA